MNISVSKTTAQMAVQAAKFAAREINRAIGEKGEARILLATGESQIEAIRCLTEEAVDWSKVVMFHLDEYMDLPETHIASFRKYLQERFVNIVNPKEAYLVDGEGDVKANIETITEKLKEAPIDVAFIGIGENGHVAFNDPPADFTTDEAYIIVDLDEKCKQQQVNEGWFKDRSEAGRFHDCAADYEEQGDCQHCAWDPQERRRVKDIVSGRGDQHGSGDDLKDA